MERFQLANDAFSSNFLINLIYNNNITFDVPELSKLSSLSELPELHNLCNIPCFQALPNSACSIDVSSAFHGGFDVKAVTGHANHNGAR